MAKVRISTTVDADLIAKARALRSGSSDASVMEAALHALLVAHREVAIDQAYARAYNTQPMDQPDDWGDLAAWREQAGAS